MRDECRLKEQTGGGGGGGGVWGHAPPGKIFKLGTLRSLLRPCLGQNATRISPPVVSVSRRMNRAARNDCYQRGVAVLGVWSIFFAFIIKRTLGITVLSRANAHTQASAHPPILTVWWVFRILRVTAYHAKFSRSESEGRSAELT